MLNMNFAKRVTIDTINQAWISSPKPGVWRKPLARAKAEQGHATSIVKYAPGAKVHAHDHPGGEEILVLEGVFSDATGDYPAGTYLRNPEGYRHAPFSTLGCIILVKLHQFQAGDNQRYHIDSRANEWVAGLGGLEILPLHQYQTEQVSLVRWPAGESVHAHTHDGGEEIYVISGELIDEHARYPAGTWIRNPQQSIHAPYTHKETLIWMKVGHMQNVPSEPAIDAN
ncbi:MAG: cupin domain-containing protein [Pseudomonadales bacterium]|nr:cupin domain-containing protein [Pseudomonadales bacterium]